MSRSKRINGVSDVLDSARQKAAELKVAERVKPVAERVKPLAKRTGAAARHQARKTRAWAGPQVERTGHALQKNVAPKVSAMLSSAGGRLAALIRNRAKPKSAVTDSEDQTTESTESTS